MRNDVDKMQWNTNIYEPHCPLQAVHMSLELQRTTREEARFVWLHCEARWQGDRVGPIRTDSILNVTFVTIRKSKYVGNQFILKHHIFSWEIKQLEQKLTQKLFITKSIFFTRNLNRNIIFLWRIENRKWKQKYLSNI